MTLSQNLPTVFLPPLPRQSLNTLSPLTPEVITSNIAHLRTSLVPSIYGVDTTASSSRAASSPDQLVKGESPSTSTSELSRSVDSNRSFGSDGSRASNSGAANNSSSHVTLDEFEREWAEKWLHGLITRGEGWLAEVEPEEDEDELELELEDGETTEMDEETRQRWAAYTEREKVLMDASALISSLAGCAAGGGITRDLVFPLDLTRPSPIDNSSRSSSQNPIAYTSESGDDPSRNDSQLVLKIYDAPLSDHTSVGVQTWGSAILLGRIFALEPWKYLAPDADRFATTRVESARDPRILELGAGTGVMSIITRKILDRMGMRGRGKVLATDYHPLVLENLSKCIRLNFSDGVQTVDDAENAGRRSKRRSRSRSLLSSSASSREVNVDQSATGVDTGVAPGLETMLLDWSTFPGIVDERSGSARASSREASGGDWTLPDSVTPVGSALTDQMRDALDSPWDMIIAADCVYDTRHAGMIRDVVKWCLRLPELNEKDEVTREGGVLHLLSPIRPTYAAETESIVRAFPASDVLPPRSERRARLETLRDDLVEDDVAGPSALLSMLSARLGKLGTNGRSGSGQNTPDSHTRQHVPSTSNSSGQATPRRFTPTSVNKVSVPHLGTESGPITPVDPPTHDHCHQVDPFGLGIDIEEILARDMGVGQFAGWVLATTQRRELQRMHGSGRSDEVEYWWWEIRWC